MRLCGLISVGVATSAQTGFHSERVAMSARIFGQAGAMNRYAAAPDVDAAAGTPAAQSGGSVVECRQRCSGVDLAQPLSSALSLRDGAGTKIRAPGAADRIADELVAGNAARTAVCRSANDVQTRYRIFGYRFRAGCYANHGESPHEPRKVSSPRLGINPAPDLFSREESVRRL